MGHRQSAFRACGAGLCRIRFQRRYAGKRAAFDAHIKALAAKPSTPARNTAVVVGAGLTGLESAAEMPQRLRDALGKDETVRVVIVDSAPEVGAGMGAEPGR